jgi:hypothetical protein
MSALVAASLACAILGAVPAIARPRSCGDAGSLRSGIDDSLSTIEVTNRRATPATVEWIDQSGAPTHRLTLAPGETTQLPTYRTHAWVGRDARRRCLSGFVADEKTEAWELMPDGDDYERLSTGGLTVYVAPEFRTRDLALLEQCLRFLESSAKRIEQAIPPKAWQRLSKVPIWLEYEADGSHIGFYYPNTSVVWGDIGPARTQSVQFTRSLASAVGQKTDPLMHELAHAYHDLVLSFANRPILAAYEHARAGGLYNAVLDVWSRRDRAYAITSHHEYFAELSVAYFGTNYYFPFTRQDLKEFDPVGYGVIAGAWEHPTGTPPSWPLSASWSPSILR